MDQLQGLMRGFEYDDNPLLLFLILGLVIFLFMGNDNISCFFEQNDFLIWIVAIIFIIFILSNREDDCCC